MRRAQMTWPVTINSLPPNPLNIHKAADLRLISSFRQPFFQNKSSQRARPNLETQIGLSPQTYDWFLIETLRPSCFGSISTRPPQKLYSSRIPKMENARLLKRRSGRGAWSYKYYEQFQIATCFELWKDVLDKFDRWFRTLEPLHVFLHILLVPQIFPIQYPPIFLCPADS